MIEKKDTKKMLEEKGINNKKIIKKLVGYNKFVKNNGRFNFEKMDDIDGIDIKEVKDEMQNLMEFRGCNIQDDYIIKLLIGIKYAEIMIHRAKKTILIEDLLAGERITHSMYY